MSGKWCSRCETEKAPEEFYVDRSRADGRTPWCKDCKKRDVRERELGRAQRTCVVCETTKHHSAFNGRLRSCRDCAGDRTRKADILREPVPCDGTQTQTCNQCKTEKLLSEYGVDRRGRLGRKLYCKSCEADLVTKKKYGMSRSEVIEKWGDACVICGGPYEHTDHCHETGIVRGPLCNGCNTGLGFMRDDPERMEAAAAYIRRSRA